MYMYGHYSKICEMLLHLYIFVIYHIVMNKIFFISLVLVVDTENYMYSTPPDKERYACIAVMLSIFHLSICQSCFSDAILEALRNCTELKYNNGING